VRLDLIDFTVESQDQVNVDIPKLKLLTLHRRNGMIFRGSAGFRGSAWRDWMVVDWGRGFEKSPSRMWGFVDLSKLRKNSRINVGGVNNLQPGVCAVAECNKHVENPSNAELITEIEIEVAGFSDGFVSKLTFHLAPVEAFVAPTVAVPTIGGENNAHMWLKPWHTWRDVFVKWLNEPCRMDDSSDSEAAGADNGDDDGDDDRSVASEDPEEEEEEATDSEEADSAAELEAEMEANWPLVKNTLKFIHDLLHNFLTKKHLIKAAQMFRCRN